MADEFPSSWRDPEYVGTVVGVLATGAVVFYAALTAGPPTPETVTFVLLAVFVPWALAREAARRWL
ncbi:MULTISPECIES: hypothetical protein [Halococcus]|uniref:Uncharacterized protein n=1 Tax=Halococcus thailandensis JCM 13552 TaxID=1227457 RepID=M0N1P5_9EURY|nr:MULTISPECIES: hypothetical protein [Halococcus]EMA51796.1 hypothetical protein C451_13621 [Halococcus thailandensis JCM 13552]